MDSPKDTSLIEKVGIVVDRTRGWLARAWKLGSLMVKGAYLIGERRRLFVKLGEEVYSKISKGEWKNSELEPLVHQLDRISKKVELEEMLIKNVRFGTKLTHRHASGSSVEGNVSDV